MRSMRCVSAIAPPALRYVGLVLLAGVFASPAHGQSAPAPRVIPPSSVSLPAALAPVTPPTTAPSTTGPSATAPLGTLPNPDSPPITLNHRVEVRGSAVKLGDIFSGPLADPDLAIAYAPAPGEKVRLDATWLADLARTHSIRWHPADASEQAVVERARVVLSSRDILAGITETLLSQGLPGETELVFNNGTYVEILAPVSSQPVVRVDDATWGDGTFTAAVTILALGQPDQHMRLAGRILPTLEVPVLTRPLGQNDLVGANDFTLLRKRASEVQPGTVTEPQRLVGMAATRPLRAGDMIQSHDVARPILVPRGETVTIILQTPYMTLTASGKALENGALGDTVRVENTRSNKILFGVVTEARTVMVRPDTASLN